MKFDALQIDTILGNKLFHEKKKKICKQKYCWISVGLFRVFRWKFQLILQLQQQYTLSYVSYSSLQSFISFYFLIFMDQISKSKIRNNKLFEHYGPVDGWRPQLLQIIILNSYGVTN